MPSVSKSDRCACGRPAVTEVCCLVAAVPETAYRPGAVTDHAAEEPIKCATFSSASIPADVRAKMNADRAAAEAESPQERRACVCPPHADAVECIDLRYNGRSPGPNSAKPRELRDECQCVCHQEDEEQALIAEEQMEAVQEKRPNETHTNACWARIAWGDGKCECGEGSLGCALFVATRRPHQRGTWALLRADEKGHFERAARAFLSAVGLKPEASR